MAVYTYLFRDFLTNAPLAQLPLSGVTFSRSISEAGELSGTLVLAAEAQVKNWKAATEPRRTCVYVDRDGVLVWGGVVTQRRPSSSGGSAEIIAKSFEWYLFRRHLKVDKLYGQWDQLDIVRDLVATMQAEPNGNIGLAVTQNDSGVLRDREWFGYERTKFGDLINGLSEVENGFEFTVDVRYDSANVPSKLLIVGFPELGQGTGRLPLEFPGNVAVHPEWPEDGSDEANAWSAIGAGEGTGMLLAEGVAQSATDELVAGVALFEGSAAYKDVTEQETLQGHANEDLVVAVDGVVPKVVLRGDMHPLFGTYGLGDTARLRVTSPYHPAKADGSPGVDEWCRILGWSVQTPERESEKVSLTVGAVR